MRVRALGLFLLCVTATAAHAQNEGYLKWSAEKVRQILTAARVNGRVGGVFGFRGLNTDRSFNYKLRATWLTGDVIRATARQIQLSERLSDSEAEALVAEASNVHGTVVLVEIDPNEGSGVIPLDWSATLQVPRPDASGVSRGVVRPEFRNMRVLSGVSRRDYNYEVFWVEFPVTSDAGAPFFPAQSPLAELVVRIHNKEGRVNLRALGSLTP